MEMYVHYIFLKKNTPIQISCFTAALTRNALSKFALINFMGYKPHIYKKSSMRPVLTWCPYINSEVSTLKSNKKSEELPRQPQ